MCITSTCFVETSILILQYDWSINNSVKSISIADCWYMGGHRDGGVYALILLFSKLFFMRLALSIILILRMYGSGN